ncbi:hypothetical protein F5884DRAFT_147453 [Xylogone sp. PMI_703]|nr:hypothetical protein F5884DRAFT_147453 [Xylogone sp. PMI_703]
MSVNSEGDYLFVESDKKLQSLAETAGNETREEALAAPEASETPVSKLTSTPGCEEVISEYYKTYHKKHSVTEAFDYQNIETYYKPEVFAWKRGPIWIRPSHFAVVIPLFEFGSPKIILTGKERPNHPPGREEPIGQGKQRSKYNIAWQPGSIHYCGGDVSLDMTGGGKAVFIFLLFKIKR